MTPADKYGYGHSYTDKKDHNDNAGSIGLSTDGELTFGIGGGLAIEADGGLAIQVAPGFSISLDND